MQHQGRHFLHIPGPSPIPDRVLRAMDMPIIDHRSAQFAELAQTIPEITECHRVTGEDSFILKLFLKEISNLDRVLDKFLAHGQTITSIVQSSPVPPRSLPLP